MWSKKERKTNFGQRFISFEVLLFMYCHLVVVSKELEKDQKREKYAR